MKLDCIGLFVENMPEMVAFYRDVMGFKTNWQGEADASFEAGSCQLIMYGRADFEKMISHEFHYPKGLNGTVELAFTLATFSDVDKTYERLLNSGVKSVFSPKTMPWGQRTCFVADPEGNLLEIGSFGNAEFENLKDALVENLDKIDKAAFSKERLKKNLDLIIEAVVNEEIQ
jgi:catechol 2,3-dioxygenase-like lactoylglutathione lyase family enzyme